MRSGNGPRPGPEGETLPDGEGARRERSASGMRTAPGGTRGRRESLVFFAVQLTVKGIAASPTGWGGVAVELVGGV